MSYVENNFFLVLCSRSWNEMEATKNEKFI